MKLSNTFLDKLKWSVYEWVGLISVEELTLNRRLEAQIERLMKALRVAVAI